MSQGLIGFSQVGDSNQPSPSIWSDCPNTLLEDKGLGYFGHVEFLGSPTGVLAAALDATMISFGDKLKIECDTDTVLTQKAAELGGYLDIETDGDDNDAAALISQPIGKIVRNSGNKLWFEARIELGAIADQGVFVGLVEEAGATRDVIADNAASNGVVTESLVGFLVDNGDTNAFDIVARKDAGTVVNVLNDATKATAITSAGGTVASLLADTEVKVGLRFDGLKHIYFYVNGYKVAALEVDSAFDQTHTFCAIVAIKTGTGAAQSIAADFTRFGAQSRA